MQYGLPFHLIQFHIAVLRIERLFVLDHIRWRCRLWAHKPIIAEIHMLRRSIAPA